MTHCRAFCCILTLLELIPKLDGQNRNINRMENKEGKMEYRWNRNIHGKRNVQWILNINGIAYRE